MQGATVVETSYISLVSLIFVVALSINKLTQIVVDTLLRWHPWTPFLAHWDQSPTTPGVCRKVAPVPITLGPWSRICLQPPWRGPRPLATALNRNQESTLYFRYLRDSKVFWRVRHWLWAGAGKGQREVWFVATRYTESLRSQVRECDERDACIYFEGEKWTRAPFVTIDTDSSFAFRHGC